MTCGGHRAERVAQLARQEVMKMKGDGVMKLSAPKIITWWIALIIGVVGILAYLVTIPVLSGFAVWLVVIAFVILILATLLKDL